MAEFEERLNAILGDPDAMGQIISIAKALTGEESRPGPAGPPAPEESAPAAEQAAVPSAPAAPSAPQEGQPNWPAILGALGGAGGGSAGGENPLAALGKLDPKIIQTAVTLFSEYSASDDRKTALLAALKPFLKPERQAKIDRAVELARLSRVIRTAFRLFQSSREEGGTDV